MFVRLELVNGNVEMFETQNFVCAPKAEMNPGILKCEVFDSSGKRRYVSERHFKAFYKKHIYKPTKAAEEGKSE